MGSDRPSVAVFMPIYNHGHLVDGAFENILSQTSVPGEIIVTDDASTDDSWERVRKWAARDRRFRFFRNETNLGSSACFNLALGRTQAKYVCALAFDDRFHARYVERSLEMMVRYPEAGLCFCDSGVLDPGTFDIRESRHQMVFDSPLFLTGHQFAEAARKLQLYIPDFTCFRRREPLVRMGGIPSGLGLYASVVMDMTLALRHGACYIPEVLAGQSIAEQTFSGRASRNRGLRAEAVLGLLDLLKSPAYRDVLQGFRRSGAVAGARLDLFRVLLARPRHWDYLSLHVLRRMLEMELVLRFPAAMKVHMWARRRAWEERTGRRLGRPS